MKSSFLILIFSSCFFSLSANAQQGIHSSGGNASGTGGSVSYSVGQVFYSSQSGTSGGLIQGVQQPFELVVTSLDQPINPTISCEVFPNPVIKELKLKISGDKIQEGTWVLTDMRGVYVAKGKISEAETLIPMAAQPMAAYSLRIFSDQKEIRTFKIIKQ